jgi:hypothetical protein
MGKFGCLHAPKRVCDDVRSKGMRHKGKASFRISPAKGDDCEPPRKGNKKGNDAEVSEAISLEDKFGLDVVQDLTNAILPLTKVSYSMYRNY